MERWQLAPAGVTLTLCHNVEPQIEVEVCAPVDPQHPNAAAAQAWELPAVAKMACTMHHGGFDGLITAFTALIRWIDRNGYRIAGPDREIYLRLPQCGQYDSDPQALTELQVPVVYRAGSSLPDG